MRACIRACMRTCVFFLTIDYSKYFKHDFKRIQRSYFFLAVRVLGKMAKASRLFRERELLLNFATKVDTPYRSISGVAYTHMIRLLWKKIRLLYIMIVVIANVVINYLKSKMLIPVYNCKTNNLTWLMVTAITIYTTIIIASIFQWNQFRVKTMRTFLHGFCRGRIGCAGVGRGLMLVPTGLHLYVLLYICHLPTDMPPSSLT